jgi:hypothetical protein
MVLQQQKLSIKPSTIPHNIHPYEMERNATYLISGDLTYFLILHVRSIQILIKQLKLHFFLST